MVFRFPFADFFNDELLFKLLGLFERHKLLFSFQMTIKIMEADGKLNPEELDFFLKGNISLEKSSRSKPFPWLPDQGWEDIQRLMTVTPEAFSSLADDIERNGNDWKEVTPSKHEQIGRNIAANSFETLSFLVFWQGMRHSRPQSHLFLFAGGGLGTRSRRL